MGDVLILILVIPVIFGVFALAEAQYSRRKMRRSGIRVQADVDEVVTVLLPTEPGVNSEAGYHVKYRYRDTKGVEHHATSEVTLEDPTPMVVGGKTLVAYDEHHPEHSIWIGR